MTALQSRPPVGEPVRWRFPDSTSVRLDNGLRLIIADLPGRALAAVHLLLDAPVVAEPPGREGLAALAAATLDEGTDRRDAEAFAEALESLGASWDAHAGEEGLDVAVQAPVRALPDVLGLLAEAVTTPAFPEAEVDRLRASRLDEIRQAYAHPPARARIAWRATIFASGERAALPDGGTEESVAGLRRDEVAGFYTRRASPALATLVLAGDLGGVEATEMIARHFGGWTADDVPRAPVEPARTAPGPRVVVVHRPGAVQTQLVVGLPAVDRRHPDYPLLRAGSYVLGGTVTSRLDAVLREEKGYTYGVRAGLEPRRRSGLWSVTGAVDTAPTGPAMQDLLRVLRGAVQDGLTATELAAAVDYLVGVAPLDYETTDAVAGHLLRTAAYELPDGWLDDHLERLRSARVEEVSDALARHLDPARLVVAVVADADQVTQPLSELGLGEVQVLTS